MLIIAQPSCRSGMVNSVCSSDVVAVSGCESVLPGYVTEYAGSSRKYPDRTTVMFFSGGPNTTGSTNPKVFLKALIFASPFLTEKVLERNAHSFPPRSLNRGPYLTNCSTTSSVGWMESSLLGNGAIGNAPRYRCWPVSNRRRIWRYPLEEVVPRDATRRTLAIPQVNRLADTEESAGCHLVSPVTKPVENPIDVLHHVEPVGVRVDEHEFF